MNNYDLCEIRIYFKLSFQVIFPHDHSEGIINMIIYFKFTPSHQFLCHDSL